MVGNILLFNKETKEGEIVGVDKKRYCFHIGEWLSYSSIEIGQKVSYEIVDNEARNIVTEKPLNKKYRVCFEIDISLVG